MAGKDLNYEETKNRRRIAVVAASETPELLKRAITLMLFSQDPDIRNFNDSSIVNVFASLPQSGFQGINLYLTLAATRIREILQETDDTVTAVYFTCEDDAPILRVSLNVETTDNILTTVVYDG
jgi:hypothetical protein